MVSIALGVLAYDDGAAGSIAVGLFSRDGGDACFLQCRNENAVFFP